jgi:ABC-type transport system involved in cytochrome bd biosynthesis fused ATPase/permease subunit
MSLVGILFIGFLVSLIPALIVWIAAAHAGKGKFECLMFAVMVWLPCLAIVAQIAPALAAEDTRTPARRDSNASRMDARMSAVSRYSRG